MLIVTLLLSFIWYAHSYLDFSGHRIYHLKPTTLDELNLLKQFTNRGEFDVWNYPSSLFEGVNIRVSPFHASLLEDQLKQFGFDFKVAVEDMQKWVMKERLENPAEEMENAFKGNINVGIYHTYDFITAYMDGLAARFPDLVSVRVFGITFEGNPIKGVKIGTPGEDRDTIWIDSCIHSREWISAAASVYMIDQLTKGYNTDEEITRMVDNFDWIIIPVLNVDGYNHTWFEDRMWRKNRIASDLAVDDPLCFGADPNRNFGVGFGGNGTSSDPCTGIYRGETAFSEAESRAVRDGVLGLGDKLKAYFAIHSYSQLWMIPFGNTLEFPEDYEDMMKVVDAAVVAVANTHGKWYKHGTIAQTIYAASGAAVDWVYKEAGIKHSYTVELRDRGQFGFLLPNSEIIPSSEELFAGIKAVVKIIEKQTNKVAPEKSESEKQSEIRRS